jgi:4-amino-4-deoxychorismate lyase
MASFLVNGLPTASIDAGDRGLQYGDGVFRTLAVRSGRALNWQRHLRLLARDCAALGLACPAQDLLAAEVVRVAPGDATVKIIVTRGAAGRGYGCDEGASWRPIPRSRTATPRATAYVSGVAPSCWASSRGSPE